VLTLPPGWVAVRVALGRWGADRLAMDPRRASLIRPVCQSHGVLAAAGSEQMAARREGFMKLL